MRRHGDDSVTKISPHKYSGFKINSLPQKVTLSSPGFEISAWRARL